MNRTERLTIPQSVSEWNARGREYLPGHLDMEVLEVAADEVRNLPQDAQGFTTIELKSNFLGTALEGDVVCVARPAHRGRTTQVWDAEVRASATGKTIALFRCTQMILRQL